MHFFSRRNASLALSLAAVGVLAACGDDVTVPIAPPAPVTISITPSLVTLNPGQTGTLSVQIAGGDPTPTLASCTSSSTSVVTAAVSGNSCAVTAVASGNATVTATTSGNQQASAAVTVNQLPSALGQLSVSPATAALSVGQNVSLVPNANPAGASVTTTFGYVSSTPAVATVSGSGVVTAVAPGTTTITVTATGTGAGFSAATRTFGVTINVSMAPPSMTALNVSPNALVIATGRTATLSASVSQPAGATAATISYASSNTANVTVSGSGANATVTAVSPGSATITVTATSPATSSLSAVTLTQLVSVNVRDFAAISIETVTQGPIVTSGLDSAYNVSSGGAAGGPTGPDMGVIAGIRQALNPQLDQSVDITNTKDQIQVRLNLVPNDATVSEVVVYIAPANDTANRRVAARQLNPTAGQIVTGFINTADFDANAATGVGDVRYPNGLKVISAALFFNLPAGSPAGACPTPIQAGNRCEIRTASNNDQSLNFNNIDGFALTMSAPLNTTLDNFQRSWWGGPTVSTIGQQSGLVSFQVWPVIYTPGRTIDRVQATFGRCNGFGVGGLPTGVEKVGAPYTYTVGSGAPATGTATHIACGGLTGAYDGLDNFRFEDYPMVTYSLDNSQNPGPRSIYAYNPTLGTDVFAGPRPSLYRQSAQVQSPNAIRVDYKGPDQTLESPSNQERWVNDSYAFSSAYSATDFNSGASSGSFPGPVGVGLFATSMRNGDRMWFAVASRNACAGPQSFVRFGTLTSTVADLPSVAPSTNREHPCDFTNDAFALQASETDRLGNRSTTTSTVANAKLFGVDNTAPTLTLSYDGAGPIADTPNHYRATGDSIFQAGGTGFATPIAQGVPNASDFYFGSRYRDTRSGFNITNHGTRTITRYAPAATPMASNVAVLSTVATRTMNFSGGSGNPVENEDPTFRRDSTTIYGGTPANFGGIALTDTPMVGYYQYALTIRDRAGNSSAIQQRAVIDNTSPQVTGVLIPAVLGASGTGTAVAQAFRPTGSDDVEAFDADLFMRYPALGMIGDSTVNSTVIAGGARMRFRRDKFANFHEPWAVFTDGLLSTPFGPGAALSDAGLMMPIPTIRGMEAVDSTDSPVHWSAGSVTRNFVGFKPNLLGIYAFDVRASKIGAWLAPYAADPSYRNHGMTNMFPSTVARPGVGDGEAAYTENLFALNVSNGTRWETKDFGTPASGFQGLVTFAGWTQAGGSVSFRANTNSVSTQPIFPTVYLVRWEPDAQVTGSGYAASDLNLNDSTRGQWIYIGAIESNAPTNPVLFDQGSTRTWQYNFTVGAVTNGRIVQNGTNTAGCFRAIGVDVSGDGIASKPFGTGCPAVAAIAGTANATITLRAYGPGTGTIVAAPAPAFSLTKSTTTNSVMRVSQNRADALQTFTITPTAGSTLQTAPAGCTLTGGPYIFPTAGAVTCEVAAGFGSRHVTAIFDSPSIP